MITMRDALKAVTDGKHRPKVRWKAVGAYFYRAHYGRTGRLTKIEVGFPRAGKAVFRAIPLNGAVARRVKAVL